jgi:hypothetical protein
MGRGLRSQVRIHGAELMRMRIGVKALGMNRFVREIHGWNSEEMKFRLAFIVFPALIGLSMAVSLPGI